MQIEPYEYKLESYDYKWRNRGIAIFVFSVISIALYDFWRERKIDKEGVYTKCTITNVELQNRGNLISFSYVFGGKMYQSRSSRYLGLSSIGSQFFIKLLPNDPSERLFLEDHEVPECLLNVAPPPLGWKIMPVCEEGSKDKYPWY